MTRVLNWMKEHKTRSIYLAAALLLSVIALFVVTQNGCYMEEIDSRAFYRLQSESSEGRSFSGSTGSIEQRGYFPDNEQVFITVTDENGESVHWTLTMKGKNADGFSMLSADDGKTVYEGIYSGQGNRFRFDDWKKYSGWETVTEEGRNATTVHMVRRYHSSSYIGSLLQIAYGQTDKNNEQSLFLFLYLLCIAAAYGSLFHAQEIFDWNKQWEFSYRNADQLEPSEWYFASSFLSAVLLIVCGLWCWLVGTGIWML